MTRCACLLGTRSNIPGVVAFLSRDDFEVYDFWGCECRVKEGQAAVAAVQIQDCFRWITHDVLEIPLLQKSTYSTNAISWLKSVVCFTGKVDQFISSEGPVWEKYRPSSGAFHCIMTLPSLPQETVGVGVASNFGLRARACCLALAVMAMLDSGQDRSNLDVDFAALCDAAELLRPS